METKVAQVLGLIKDLGFEVVYTSSLYGVADAGVLAENEDRSIRTAVTSTWLDVTILSSVYGSEAATFYFTQGEAPDLHFRKYTPEMLELARRFAVVTGCEI